MARILDWVLAWMLVMAMERRRRGRRPRRRSNRLLQARLLQVRLLPIGLLRRRPRDW